MKFRTIVLAGAAALALSGPALASDATGWYVGLGVGWAHMDPLAQKFGVDGWTGEINRDTAIFAATGGYRFENRIRIENELSYDSHGLHHILSEPSGHTTVITDYVNLLYDYPLAPKWDLTVGAGVGYSWIDLKYEYGSSGDYLLKGTNGGFAWQLIAGVTYSLSDLTDLSLDYRYRALSADGDFYSDTTNGSGKIDDVNEHMVMLTARFYLSEPPPHR